MTTSLYIVLRVGDAEYALLAVDVLVIEAFTGATPVPGVAPHVAGLVQVRGDVVPVVDLRVLFRVPETPPTADSRVAVVTSAGRRVGLLVDAGREVVKLSPSVWKDPPELVSRQSRGFVRSIAHVGTRLLMLLDIERVVGTEALDGER